MSANSLVVNGTNNPIFIYGAGNGGNLPTMNSVSTITLSGGYEAHITSGSSGSYNTTWVFNVPNNDNTKYILIYPGQTTISQSPGYNKVIQVLPVPYFKSGTVCSACTPSTCNINTSTYYDNTCTTPSNRYSCINGSCTPAANGRYQTEQNCQLQCVGTQKYSCNNGTCSVNANGQYTSLSDCNANCSVTQNYSCINGTCTPDTNGQYKSQEACNANCSITQNYSCTNGTCTPDTNGQYTSSSDCLANCTTSSSNTWIWILVTILVIIIIITIIGVIGFVIYENKKKEKMHTAALASSPVKFK